MTNGTCVLVVERGGQNPDEPRTMTDRATLAFVRPREGDSKSPPGRKDSPNRNEGGTGGLQPPAPPVTTALVVERGSTTPHGVSLCARRTNASRNVTGMPTRRLTGTSVNTGPCVRPAAGRVWPSMAQKPVTAPTRRPEAA
jgi:hypothetical protein